MVYGIANTDPLGVIVPTDAADRWIRGIPWHPEAGEHVEQYDPAACTTIVRSAVGVSTLPVTILGVKAFGMAAGLVDRYRSGRMLLVGDAAHIFPPTTGMGLNVALHDGVRLAHCLAQVLKHGSSLETLDAYEAERRPIAETLLASDLAV